MTKYLLRLVAVIVVGAVVGPSVDLAVGFHQTGGFFAENVHRILLMFFGAAIWVAASAKISH